MGQSRLRLGPYGYTYLLPGYHGQSRLRHWAIWPNILFFLDIMGVKTPSSGHMTTHSLFRDHGYQDSVSGPYGQSFSSWISWAVKTSVTGPYGHTFSFPDIMGSQDSVTSRTVYGRHNSLTRSWIINTPAPGIWPHFSFLDIMGSQDSVTGPYSHTLSSPEIMAVKTQSLVVTVYGYTISFFDIMGSQYSVTEPYGHTFSCSEIMGSHTP
ncbi:hypothetical protein BgiBS90_038330 [Biomphalaria glabrata]|nr:hypothetical protein BgiBS90_038330 [Biomphalaria glabrata]